jgi:hypothetical protein
VAIDEEIDPTQVLKTIRAAKAFQFFPTRHDLANYAAGVVWDGPVEGFLAFAKSAGVTTLYVFDGTVPADDEVDLEPSCDVGFLLNGVMHVFSTADRILGEESEPGAEPESPVAEYLTDHRADLVEEAGKRARADPDVGFGSGGAYEHHLRILLKERMGVGVPIPHFGDFDTSPVVVLGRAVVGEIRRASEEAEKPLVEALYPKWLEFARNIGPATLSQGDLEVFLSREEQHFSRSARQRLWTQAKADLRSERTAAKLARVRS